MKNSRAITMALILSMTWCMPEITIEAKESEKIGDLLQMKPEGSEVKELLSGYKNENVADENMLDMIREEKSDASESIDNKDENKQLSEVINDNDGLKQLQIPQKFGIVVDPWEMDGKGQIYSEQYVIKNAGENPGILTLSNLSCVPQEDEVIVRTNPAGMHDSDEKAVYMQMQFGNGEQIVLSQENSEYQVELQPEEELSICFKGEVNEYAKNEWEDDDIAVSVVYSWNESDTGISMEEAAMMPVDEADVTDEKEEKEKSVEETGVVVEAGETGENEGLEVTDKTDSAEERKDLPEGKELREIVELQDSSQLESWFTIDYWEIDESGNICTGWYTIRNIGEKAGTFTISELLCNPSEESGIAVWTEGESIDSENKSLHMELISGDGQRLTLETETAEGITGENLVESGESGEAVFKIELGAGEESSFRFAGELRGTSLEELKDGDIAVTARYSWSLGE